MQSLKSFWPLRARLPLTLTPDVALLGRFALIFGFLSVAVLWLLAPGPSLQRAAPAAVNPGVVEARVNPAPRRALSQEITEPDEEATSEVPGPTVASAAPEASIESEPAPGPAAPAPAAVAVPAPVIAQQLPVTPPASPVPVEVEPQLVSVAASGQRKLAVIRLGSEIQTVTTGGRIGSWLVRQIRADQVVVQQGNRTRVLAFGRSGTSPTPVSSPSNTYSSAPPSMPIAPAVQPTPPPFEQGRPPQPQQAAPIPPEVNQDSEEENPNQQPNQPDER